MLKDEKFLLKCLDLDIVQYIDSGTHIYIIKFILDFYKTYSTIPTMDSIKIKIQEQSDEIFKTAITNTFVNIINSFQENNLQFIKDSVINFCRYQELKSALIQAIDLLKQKKDYDKIYDIINSTKFKGIDADLGKEYVSSFFDRHKPERSTWIQTPWPVINSILSGGAKSGGLHIILAPPGVGKSWFLVNIAANALKLNKKVLFVTLQMTENQIAERMDIKLTEKPRQWFYITQNLAKAQIMLQPYKDNLIIKKFIAKQTKVGQIETFIEQLKLFNNFMPELLIVDYGDILKRESNNNMYDAYGDIFVGLKSIAQKYDIPVWTATQGNRSSINSELLLGDSTAHSIEKLQIADFVVSMSRTQQDKLTNTARFVIVKNRNNIDGMVYNGIVDFTIGRMEMYQNHTKKSLQARERMDKGNILVKNKVRDELQILRNKNNINGGNVNEEN